MKKAIILVAFTILILLLMTSMIYGANEQADASQLKPIEDSLQNLNRYFGDTLDPQTIMSDAVRGKISLSPEKIFFAFTTSLLNEVSGGIGVLISIVSICYVTSFLFALGDSENITSSEAGYFVAFAILALQIAISFNLTAQWGWSAIKEMQVFMHASVPLLASLSISIANPTFVIIVQSIAYIIPSFFMPLALIHGGLGIVEGISTKFSLKGMQNLIKSIFMWGLGICMTIFTGVMALSGAVSKTFTGVGSKTLRFAADSMVPVVGTYLSQAADAVFTSTGIIRDAAGIGVTTAIILIGAAPFTRVMAVVILYKLAAVMVQPVVNERMSRAINSASESMTMIMGLIAVMGILFIMNTAIFISAGRTI